MIRKIFLVGIIASCFANNSHSLFNSSYQLTNADIFVGSTPGDSLIKSLIGIHSTTKVDFMKWELTFNNQEKQENTFELIVSYGESELNTPGFKEGGGKLFCNGKYSVSKDPDRNLKGEIYQLRGDKLPTILSLVKINDNLFHLLSPGNNLMLGNDGWSYTLNRKEPLTNISVILPALTPSKTLINDTAQKVIYAGRTPCLDFAKEYNYKVSNDCTKLKWELILYRHPKTFVPTTYSLYWTLHRSGVVEGKWTIIHGTAKNPDVILYQLNPDKPSESISFLLGDKNVLYFLDKKNQLFTGNKDFSYTLNKMKD